MIDLIENNRAAIEELCRSLSVARLDLFGSAADGRFDPSASDVDVLVEFVSIPDGTLFDRYMALKWGLEALLDRRVDVVTIASLTDPGANPYFVRAVKESRRALYAA